MHQLRRNRIDTIVCFVFKDDSEDMPDKSSKKRRKRTKKKSKDRKSRDETDEPMGESSLNSVNSDGIAETDNKVCTCKCKEPRMKVNVLRGTYEG